MVNRSRKPECVYYKEQLPKNIEFKLGNAENLISIDDSFFDVVVSFETIEHLRNIDLFLAEISRVLKQDGVFIVSTPDRRLASSKYPLRRKPNNPFHVKEYTKMEFQKILERKGFQIIDLLGQGYVNSVFAFWPIHALLKSACYIFRKFGAYRFIDKVYHIGSGSHVHSPPHKFMVANYWIAYCTNGKNS